MYAYCFEGERYDVGDKFGFLKANIEYALKRDGLKDELIEYLLSIKNRYDLGSKEEFYCNLEKRCAI